MRLTVSLTAVLAVVVVAPLSGCELLTALFNQSVDLPLDLTSPEQDVDVDGPIADAEASACTAPDAASCVTLTAVCQTDGTADCATPHMPAEFPKEVEVVPGDPPVQADQIMTDLGIDDATEIKVALPIDVASRLADEGVQTPDAIQEVSVSAFQLLYPNNSLTFDAPPLDLYVANEDLGADADAEQLIADGTVKKIGTIGSDLDGDGTIDVGQPAGSTDPAPVAFVEGGNDLLNEALKSPAFTIVTAVPEGKGFALKEKDGDATTVLKPAGQATLQLKVTLVYTVSAADIVDKVQ